MGYMGQDDSYDYNDYEYTVPTESYDTGTTDTSGSEFTGPLQVTSYEQESIDALNQALLDAQNSGDTQSQQQIEQQLNQMEQQIAGYPGSQPIPEQSFLSKLLGATGGLTGGGGGAGISTTPKAPSVTVLPASTSAGLLSGSTGLVLAGFGILALFMLSNRK